MAESLTTKPTKVDSLSELFEQLEAPLLHYACHMVKRPEIAQDLVQEAFLKLHAAPGLVRQPKAWLYRTIHNLAVNYHRKENRVVPLVPDGAESPAPEPVAPETAPDDQITRLETIELVRQLLRGLPPKQQELLRLKFEEDLSYEAISERTGLSVGNVGYRLHKLIKSLAAQIENHEDFR